MLNKNCTWTAKSAPYPPCTVTTSRLKYQDPARVLRRVTQPPFIAGPLGATLKDDTTDNKRTVKRQIKCQRFSKIKRAASHRTSQPKCSTFYFAPTHHDSSDIVNNFMWTFIVHKNIIHTFGQKLS